MTTTLKKMINSQTASKIAVSIIYVSSVGAAYSGYTFTQISERDKIPNACKAAVYPFLVATYPIWSPAIILGNLTKKNKKCFYLHF